MEFKKLSGKLDINGNDMDSHNNNEDDISDSGDDIEGSIDEFKGENSVLQRSATSLETQFNGNEPNECDVEHGITEV